MLFMLMWINGQLVETHWSRLVSEFRLAVVQLQVSSVKPDNLSRARRLVTEAARQGSQVVLLPVRRSRRWCGGEEGRVEPEHNSVCALFLSPVITTGVLQFSVWDQLLLWVRREHSRRVEPGAVRGCKGEQGVSGGRWAPPVAVIPYITYIRT